MLVRSAIIPFLHPRLAADLFAQHLHFPPYIYISIINAQLTISLGQVFGGGGPTSAGRPGHSKTAVPKIAPNTCRPQTGKLKGSLNIRRPTSTTGSRVGEQPNARNDRQVIVKQMYYTYSRLGRCETVCTRGAQESGSVHPQDSSAAG